MARLELRMLGSFDVSLDQQPVTNFESIKVRALLAYLSVEGYLPHRRESLAGLLWPDWPNTSAMSSLRNALADLRKCIGDRDIQPPFLTITRDSIQFSQVSDAWVDAWEFNAQTHQLPSASLDPAQIDGLNAVISLYRGPFLEGFSLNDSPAFEQWLLQEREQLHRRMLQALSRMADHYAQGGDYTQALTFAWRQVELEPSKEEAHQQVMRLLAHSGQRSAALAQFEKCCQLLDVELGVKPGAYTLELYAQIRDGKLAANPSGGIPITSEKTAAEIKIQEPGPHHNLPRQLTGFIGREKEISQVMALVQSSPLVTLTGSGGVGKTRLSLAVAEKLLGEFPDGIWCVELASLSNPDLLPQTVAAALGVQETPGSTISATLVGILRAKHLLLILDNCEHLVETVARLADELLRACPDLHILATSRELLGIPGEEPFRVPSLAIPETVGLPFETMTQYDAVSLFVARAQTASAGFVLSKENAADIVQICQRLDGIPLALELAAARLRVLSTAQIAQRLDDSFRLLTAGSRTALPRHQTLRALIDWSYNLLPGAEQLLIGQLAVFSGGWTLEAAEAVCTGEDTLGRLGSLVDKSLVLVSQEQEHGRRYHMLETVRQYALEKLYEAGEVDTLRRRHLDYFLKMVETCEPDLHGRKQIATLNRLETELANLRAAMQWALEEDPIAELRIASALKWLWWIHDRWTEGIQWLEKGLSLEVQARGAATTPERVALRAKATSAIGQLYIKQLETKNAKKLLEESLGLYRQLGDIGKNGAAYALVFLFSIGLEGDTARAIALAREGLELHRQAGDEYGQAESLFFLGQFYLEKDPEKARFYFEECLAQLEKTGDPDLTGSVFIHLGLLANQQQFYEQAEAMYLKSLDYCRLVGNRMLAADNCFQLCNVNLYKGDYQQALSYLQGPYIVYEEFIGQTYMLLESRIMMGRILWAMGDLHQAIKFYEDANALLSNMINEKDRLLERVHIWVMSLFVEISTEDWSRITTEYRQICKLPPEWIKDKRIKPILYIMIEVMGIAAAGQQHNIKAARLFGAAQELNQEVTGLNTLSPAERSAIENSHQAVRIALGEEQYAIAAAEGRAIGAEQILAQELG